MSSSHLQLANSKLDHVKAPSTPSQKPTDLAREYFSNSSHKRPSTSDGTATAKVTSLTRPKFRRRGCSIASPAITGPDSQPQTPDSRPKTSPTVTSPTPILSPAQSLTSVSAASLTQQSNPSNDVRSPTSKRQPASRSCHGIETSQGPPPAISTQRAYSSEIQWKLSANKENFGSVYPKLTPHALAQLDAANNENKPPDIQTEEHKVKEEPEIIQSIESTGDSKSEEMVATLVQPQPGPAMDRERKRYSMEADKRASQRLSALLANGKLAPREEGSEKSSQEDLFLNMAHRDGDDDDTINANQEQRKQSRIAVPSTRLPLNRGQSSEQTVPTKERRSSLKRPEVTTDFRTPPSLDRVSTRDRTYAASAHPLETRYASRPSGVLSKPLPLTPRGERKDSLQSPSLAVKRFSDIPSYQPRGYRSSHLQNGTDVHHFSSPITTIRRGSVEQDTSPPLPKGEGGTESSISTTAPSTVWDELDDLKSRIRKLELTGRIPPSSGAAMSSATERPRTATTTVTTMSSSPKRNNGQSTSPSTPSFDDTSPHPLLNSALAKAKPYVTEATWRALEITASDAQTLAKMVASGSSGTGPVAIDRQLKRKADSMCRNLTELCITLATKQNESDRPQSRSHSRARSASREAVTLHYPSNKDEAVDPRFQRARSLDPEPTNTQRVLSRLEARRTSMMKDESPSGNTSPMQEQYSEVKTPTQATLSRTSTVLQRLRRNADDEGDNTIRPLSRAATELGRANTTGHTTTATTASKRTSREYTSSHPLPTPESRSLAAQAYLPPRRSYLSNGSSIAQEPRTPTTPGSRVQRRYLSQSNDGNGSSLLESRRRLMPSGQYTSSNAARSTLGSRFERKSTGEE